MTRHAMATTLMYTDVLSVVALRVKTLEIIIRNAVSSISRRAIFMGVILFYFLS